MKYRQLLEQSKNCLDKKPAYIDVPFTMHIFSSGAKWMSDQLNVAKPNAFDPTTNFGFYGILKYGICLLAFFATAILLWHINIFLVPLSVLVFYFCEVHFLFLFPLLIDRVKFPLFKSIRLSYATGIFTCMATVIPISIYMLAGLVNIKAPFKNWHTGSLAILIWYKNEIRDRL